MLNVSVCELVDAVVDPTVMTDAALAYSVRSVSLQRELAEVIQLLQEVEQDGCYLGEGHSSERVIRAKMALAVQLLDATMVNGRRVRLQD